MKRSSNWGMAVLSPEGTSGPFPYIKSLWVALEVLKAGQAQAVDCMPGCQGQGTAHLPDLTGGDGGTKGTQGRPRAGQVRAPGPHLTCYVCSPGAARGESMLVLGQAGRKSPSSPTPALFTESCGLLEADYSSSVTFRESEVRECSGQVSSSPRRSRGPAPPAPPRL